MECYRCPSCKGSLIYSAKAYRCNTCNQDYEITNNIPDFYVDDPEHDFTTDANVIWLEPDIVRARDTYYKLSTRELKGMAFCMKELGQRTFSACKILEVCMGTGHFTGWLSEVSDPSTSILAYDFSWPIIERATANNAGVKNVSFFRANTRTVLPFSLGYFDIVFNRLAPLGPRSIPNIKFAFDLLRPGGWYFNAGWKAERFETSPTDWAAQHGYENAEHHEWNYTRRIGHEEAVAIKTEFDRMSPFRDDRKTDSAITALDGEGDKKYLIATEENLLIAQKPCV